MIRTWAGLDPFLCKINLEGHINQILHEVGEGSVSRNNA